MAVKARDEITLSSVVDIKATYRYYLLQSSTLAKPAAPTVFPPPAAWDDSEPSYTEGSTNSLYVVDCTVFSDNTYKYSPVSLSTSYEAAKVAYNKATTVETTTNAAITQLESEINLRAKKTEVTTEITNKINNVKIGGRNLYVIKDSVPGYIVATSGLLDTQHVVRTECTSAFIPVAPGDVYQFQVWVTPIGDTSTEYLWMAYAFYDADQAYLNQNRPSQTGGTILANGQTYNSFSFTVPSGATYVRVSARLYEDGKIKLEKGTKATDYTPAPEDMATSSDIEQIVQTVKSNEELLADLKVASDGISASVSELRTTTEENATGLAERITQLQQSVDAKITSDQVKVEISEYLNDGVNKVDTTTGITIDIDGIRVENTGADTWTQITENGMTITESDAAGEVVLTANSNGVDARNLHATTYLIVGQNSRFEDYMNGTRTGCFWIGR